MAKKLLDIPESQVKVLNIIAAKKGTDCKNLMQAIIEKYVEKALLNDTNDKLR